MISVEMTSAVGISGLRFTLRPPDVWIVVRTDDIPGDARSLMCGTELDTPCRPPTRPWPRGVLSAVGSQPRPGRGSGRLFAGRNHDRGHARRLRSHWSDDLYRRPVVDPGVLRPRWRAADPHQG